MQQQKLLILVMNLFFLLAEIFGTVLLTTYINLCLEMQRLRLQLISKTVNIGTAIVGLKAKTTLHAVDMFLNEKASNLRHTYPSLKVHDQMLKLERYKMQ